MNTARIIPAHVLYRIMAAAVLMIGIGLAAGYGYMLIFQPDSADQLTALFVIGITMMVGAISPFAGFLLWLFLIPFALFLPFDIHMPAGVPDLSFTRVVGGFLSLYILAQIARGRRRFHTLTPIEVIIPFFVIALLMAAIRAGNGWLWGTQAVFDSYIIPLLVYFIARQVIQSPREFKTMGSMFIIIGVLIAGLAILEQTTGLQLFRGTSTSAFYTDDIRKVGGLLGNPAYISLAIAIIIPLALSAITTSTSMRERLGLWIALLILGAGIIFTYNRSGWIGGLVAVTIVVLLQRRIARYAIPALFVVGVGLALAWGSLEESAAGQRITSEEPIDYRLEALQYGLEIHKDEPLLGIGWGSFGRIAIGYGFRPAGNVHVLPSTHNTYLNLLVSGGYVLLGTFLALGAAVGFTLLRTGFRFREQGRSVPLYLLAAWASLLAYYIPSAGFDNNFALYANIIFWAIIGGVLSAAFADLSHDERETAPALPLATKVSES